MKSILPRPGDTSAGDRAPKSSARRTPASRPPKGPPRLHAPPQRLQYDDVLRSVQRAVRDVLGRQEDGSPDVPLMSGGLDSLGAVELRNALETSLHVELPTTLVSNMQGNKPSQFLIMLWCNAILSGPLISHASILIHLPITFYIPLQVFDYPTPAAMASFIVTQKGEAEYGAPDQVAYQSESLDDTASGTDLGNLSSSGYSSTSWTVGMAPEWAYSRQHSASGRFTRLHRRKDGTLRNTSHEEPVILMTASASRSPGRSLDRLYSLVGGSTVGVDSVSRIPHTRLEDLEAICIGLRHNGK